MPMIHDGRRKRRRGLDLDGMSRDDLIALALARGYPAIVSGWKTETIREKLKADG